MNWNEADDLDRQWACDARTALRACGGVGSTEPSNSQRGDGPDGEPDEARCAPSMTSGPGDLVLSADGRPATVRWDARRSTFQADVELFPAGSGLESAVLPAEAVWPWLCHPVDGVFPTTLRFGSRLAQFITVDALAHHLENAGLGFDGDAWPSLLELRDHVTTNRGEVIIAGRRRPEPSLELVLPDGETLAIEPVIRHPDHRFDWGTPGSGTLRTARTILHLVWSDRHCHQSEVIAEELAVAILGDVVGGFEFAANSVADWIVAESDVGTRSSLN